MRHLRTSVQMIFQDPISSLNPRRKVRDIVMEPLNIWKFGTKQERIDKVNAALEDVGIDPVVAGDRRPHQFSGGQCQRICIARALVLDPSLIICDEPVSALDVSVQAQVLNLLEDLKQRHGLTLIFIAHDLAVVKNISDRVAVMYLGKLCEVGPADDLYPAPAHHYTKVLLDSIPAPIPARATTDRRSSASRRRRCCRRRAAASTRAARRSRPLQGRGAAARDRSPTAFRRLPLPAARRRGTGHHQGTAARGASTITLVRHNRR